MKKLNVVGKRFGRLLVISETENKDGSGRRKVLCQCDCGKQKTTVTTHLVDGHTKSCGCLQKERASSANTTHGAAVGYKRTPEYRSYLAAKGRCENHNGTNYYDYGGRGIKFLFASFEQFFSEVGPRPKAKTLERINNDGNYELGNVRWATLREQSRNTRKRSIDRVNYRLLEAYAKVATYNGRHICHQVTIRKAL